MKGNNMTAYYTPAKHRLGESNADRMERKRDRYHTNSLAKAMGLTQQDFMPPQQAKPVDRRAR